MFSSKGKDKDTVTTTPAAPVPPGGRRPMRSSAAPSIISADLTVTGTLVSSGDIQIDGRVEGDVKSAGLVVGEKAFILGDVMAEEITVRGRVQGSIKAHKVLLASTCHVEGNILHEAFAVETGAFFEGNCRHADNPLEEEGAKKPAAAPTPAPAAQPASPAPHAPQASTATGIASRPMTNTPTTGASYTPLKS